MSSHTKTIADSYRAMNSLTQAHFNTDDTVMHHLAGTIHHLNSARRVHAEDAVYAHECAELASAHADTAGKFANSGRDHARAAHAHELMRDHFKSVTPGPFNDSAKQLAVHHSKQANFHNDYGN